ncbi:hypothetical protein GBB54_05910 [Bifidobacterium longum]|uniref:Glycosyltransferase RgtA/B/C/D-like domain-containing protein n=2 Tax=Bifidobacterium TaxID=1678 RepID=A0A6I1DLN1_BIFLN|nr:hypothetical protein GBB79_10385 [Bifidobacterium longum]KAB7327780.1 hypothetical protein GBB71_10615 [Bifidobacterium longum]KAB7333554.1 hypothetical protein GBB81_10635 [Bifidobacterium longum]KAB7334498.1 hypothetical protein GBB73_10780 [Bifidobacterium longum]KAB7336553.1 hypothetical protein GBB72_10515 [Bifidobacterium longum]
MKQATKSFRITEHNFAYLVPILLGTLFGMCSFIGQHEGKIDTRNALLYVNTLFYIALFTLLFFAATKIVPRINHHNESLSKPFEAFRKLTMDWSPRSIITLWCLVTAFWIPYFVAYFPGVYWYDTSWQLMEYYDPSVPFTDHHPFMMTYLYVGFAHIGKALFNNAIYGLYLLVLVQSLLSTLAIACTVCYTGKYNTPWKCRFFIAAFLTLFPIIPMMSMSLAKDTFNTPFFVFFSIAFCELWRTQGEILKSVSFNVFFILDVLAVSLTKKTGMYIIVLALLLLACFVVKHWSCKIATIVLGSVPYLVVGIIVPTFILPALHIDPGESNEILAVPMQQVANVVHDHKDDLSAAEIDKIQQTYHMDIDQLQGAYCWYKADPIKGQELSSKDVHALITTWMKQLVKHPGDMIAGWGGLSVAWFSFNVASGEERDLSMMLPINNSKHHYQNIEQYIPWTDNTKAGNAIGRFYADTLSATPIFNIIWQKAFWATILPCAIMFLILRSKKNKLNLLMLNLPMFITMLVLFAGPISTHTEATRYVLPMLYIIPLFLSLTLKHLSLKNPKSSLRTRVLR